MSDLVLIPYIQVRGEWTLPDEVMKGLYRLMVQEGTAKTVFYSGTVKNDDEFLRACRGAGTHTIVILTDTGEPAAIGWLNNFLLSTAHAHWLCFKGIWGTEKTHEAIKKTLEYWFHFEAGDGPLFEVLLGIYPEDNRHINSFAQKAGFTVIGTIPKLLYNFWENRKVGAIISYIERGTVCRS
jgi:hypothetical protein